MEDIYLFCRNILLKQFSGHEFAAFFEQEIFQGTLI
jgi:hypothetical protein